jgi:hypothetical protein
MNNKINELVKNMIDENVVSFKENTTKILYEKTGKKIENMYETVAKNLLKQQNNETNN